MKRKKFGLPVGLVAVLAVIGMGMMGVAYAAWSATATISGSVTSGDLSLTLAANSPAPAPSALYMDCEELIAGPATAISLKATDIYPGQNCTWTITLENTGSIPGTVTLDSNSGLSDNFGGDLVLAGDCTTLIATPLLPAGTTTCTVSVTYTDVLGQSQPVTSPSFTLTFKIAQ